MPPEMIIFKKNIPFLLFFLLLTLTFSAKGQELQVSFSAEQVAAASGELVNTHLKIVNTTVDAINAKLVLDPGGEVLRMVSAKERDIYLAASDSIFISVKAMVSSGVEAGENHRLQAKIMSGDSELAQEELPVQIRKISMLKMTVLEKQLLYDERGDTLSIPVRIRNSGNTDQTFQVLSRFAFERNKDELETKEIRLQAFGDTTVYISKQVDGEILKLDNFNIFLKGLYNSGDIFGSGSVNASSVKNKRRYTTEIDPYSINRMGQTNLVSLSAQSNRGNMQYFFYANNEVDLQNGVLSSNIDVNWWENSDRVMLRNTWVGFDAEDYGIKAGNIFRSGDVNLIGRGVEAYYNPSADQVIEMGGIDRSYDLLSSYNSGFGKAGWIRFSEDGGWLQNGYEGSIIYEDEPRTDQRNVLATGKTSIVNERDLKIRAGLSASNSMLYSDAATNKSGGAGEISFFARDGNISINGDYFFSSGYFTGLRRGATQINQRVSYRRDRNNFWVGYNLLNYQPKRISEIQFTGSDFATDRYFIGLARRFNNLTVSLSPNYYEERRKSRFFSRDTPGTTSAIKAKRLSLGLNYSEPYTRQNANLNLEGGYFSTNLEHENEPHFKINFNYNWRFFNLNTFYQYNFFYVGELLSGSGRPTEGTYSRASIVPSVQQSFFENKLNLRAGLSYSSNSFSDDFFQLNGRVDYELPYNFNVFLSTFYSDFSSYYYDSSTFHFGVVKRFGSISLKDKKHRLEVFVYYDENSEEGSGNEARPAAGEMVLINNKVFRANEEGIVTYKGLPEGDYKIRMFNTNEWYAGEREISLDQNSSVAIGMNRTVSVQGKISYLFSEQSYEVEKKMMGHSISFTDREGEIFTTRTDDKGNFRIYIPDGTYTVNLDASGLPEPVEVIDNSRLVEIRSGEAPRIDFELKVQDRKIDRKRFEARPFSRDN